MAKFPLLEQLRIDRQRKEAEIKALVIKELNRQIEISKHLNGVKQILEDYNVIPIREQINDLIANKFFHDLVAEVYTKIKDNLHKPVTITIDPQTFDWARPSSIQKQVLYQATRAIDFTVFSYKDDIQLKTVQFAEVTINRTFRYQIPENN